MPARSWVNSSVIANYLGMIAVLAVLIAFFSLRTEHFFSPLTFKTIANSVPATTVVAVGMTLVLIIGGIDLSVGSVLAFSGAVLGGALAHWGWPLPLAIAACLATGAACGLVSGCVVTTWSLPSFIATLGMLEIARGCAYLTTSSQTQYIGAQIEMVQSMDFVGLSLPFMAAILTVVLAQVVVSYSVFGRRLIAIGTREEAARLSGIAIAPHKIMVFTLSGLLSAVGAVIHCSRLSAADPNAGIGLELQAIAAAVIGGTSLMGGRGSVFGTFLGVLIIAVLESGLAQIGAQEPTKRLVTGLVIVIAVVIDYYRHNLRFGKSRKD